MAIITQWALKRLAESGGRQDDPSPPFEGISAGLFLRVLLLSIVQLFVSAMTFAALLVYVAWIVALALFVMFIPYLGIDPQVYSTAMRSVMNSWTIGVTLILTFIVIHPLLMALAFRGGVRSAEDDIMRAKKRAAKTNADSSWR